MIPESRTITQERNKKARLISLKTKALISLSRKAY
jgi:hypothetical protein